MSPKERGIKDQCPGGWGYGSVEKKLERSHHQGRGGGNGNRRCEIVKALGGGGPKRGVSRRLQKGPGKG